MGLRFGGDTGVVLFRGRRRPPSTSTTPTHEGIDAHQLNSWGRERAACRQDAGKMLEFMSRSAIQHDKRASA